MPSPSNAFNTALDSKPHSVSFIGLGAMGYPMASHLCKTFDDVRVYNRTSSVANKHATEFGSQAVELDDALTADVIFSCLPTSTEVSDLIKVHADKFVYDRDQVWVDCTSGVPDAAKRLSKILQPLGVYFLDAPVSGQTSGAKAGTLTVMVGGDADALAYATPAIACFAGLVQQVGVSGAGFAVKAINNTMMAANLWAACEGLSILKAHGVDLAPALNCINASSGQSLASSNILPNRILNRAFPNTFAIDLLAKDCRIATDLQSAQKLPAPVLAQVASLVRAASNQHEAGAADFSQMATWLEQMTGIMLE